MTAQKHDPSDNLGSSKEHFETQIVAGLEITQASDAHSHNIKALIFSVLKEYGLPLAPDTTDKDLDRIDEHYTNAGGYFGIVCDNHDIVATVALYKVDDRTCELRKMYILPQFRGKGLGKRLLMFALAKARELGFKHITLETASPLVEAIRLYKGFGFTEFQPQHMADRCDQALELWLE